MREADARARPGPAAVVPVPPGRADPYVGLVPLVAFADAADPARYVPLPDDWVLGLADVVESTRAIAQGRYKTVNMLGAAVITAVTNALPGRVFPFVFGGDGASVALPAADAAVLAEALGRTAAFARDELGLSLRVALVPVVAARAAGHDVRVARFAPSPEAASHLAYAMFAGGGLAWAEAQLKAGAFALAPAPSGARPDLAGLSCRFRAIPARRGVVLSLIVVPGPRPEAFPALVRAILRLADEDGAEGRPLPVSGPMPDFLPEGGGVEARALGGPFARVRVAAKSAFAALVFRTGLRLGGFDPRRYRRTLAVNADFRKFDDGLRMTLDCSLARADALAAALAGARDEGACRYGLHRQGAAHLTCFTPAASRMDHIHFVDGADGGYAAAARALKAAEGAGP